METRKRVTLLAVAAAGAMRGYGIPQAMFAFESCTEDICHKFGFDPIAFRRKNLMPVGFVDPFSHNEMYFDTYNQCLTKGAEAIDYERKYKEYQNQTGPVRRGIGVAAFWYNTAVYPIALETSSCRMVMNQDGSIQMQLGETEIGQGADTAYTQMAAEVLGVPDDMVHVISCQDTDVTPFGTGAYASRQTYTAGFSIRQTGILLKEKVLDYAQKLSRMPKYNLDVVDGNVVRKREAVLIREILFLHFIPHSADEAYLLRREFRCIDVIFLCERRNAVFYCRRRIDDDFASEFKKLVAVGYREFKRLGISYRNTVVPLLTVVLKYVNSL